MVLICCSGLVQGGADPTVVSFPALLQPQASAPDPSNVAKLNASSQAPSSKDAASPDAAADINHHRLCPAGVTAAEQPCMLAPKAAAAPPDPAAETATAGQTLSVQHAKLPQTAAIDSNNLAMRSDNNAPSASAQQVLSATQHGALAAKAPAAEGSEAAAATIQQAAKAGQPRVLSHSQH